MHEPCAGSSKALRGQQQSSAGALRCAFETVGVIVHTLECSGIGWGHPDTALNHTATPHTADSEWACFSNELTTRGGQRASTVMRHDLPIAVGELNQNGILARPDMQSDRIGLILRHDLPAASRGCAFPYDAHSGVETSTSTPRICSAMDSARQYVERRVKVLHELCKGDGKFSAAAWRHFKQTPLHCCELNWPRALDAQHELWRLSQRDGCLRSAMDYSGWRNEVHVSWAFSDVHAVFYLAHPNPARERAACMRAHFLRMAATAVHEATAHGVVASVVRSLSGAADGAMRDAAAAQRPLPLYRLNATANFGRGVRSNLPGLALGVHLPILAGMAYPIRTPSEGCH